MDNADKNRPLNIANEVSKKSTTDTSKKTTTLEHYTSKNKRTNSSVLDFLMIGEELNKTPTTSAKNISPINRMVGIEEQGIRNNQSTSDREKWGIIL